MIFIGNVPQMLCIFLFIYFMDTFDLCYELLVLGAPDRGTIFKDWPNISAICSGQYSLVS